MDQDKMSTLYRGLPIDTAYKVSVDLAKRFQRWAILVSDWPILKNLLL
jgi:hypothetical protein